MTLADTSTKRPQSFHLAAITVVRKIVLISKDGFFVSGNDYSAGIFVERNSITGQFVQAVDLLVRRVAYWHRAHFHIVSGELILETQCRFQRISKAAIRRSCMSIDLNYKKFMGHDMTDAAGFRRTPR